MGLKMQNIRLKMADFASALVNKDSNTRKGIMNIGVIAIFIIVIIALVSFIQIVLPVIEHHAIRQSKEVDFSTKMDSVALLKQKAILTKQVNALQKKLDTKIPKGNYLTVNTGRNTYTLYKNQKAWHTGKCSTGSYTRLEAENNKEWLFKTPKGEFFIQGKTSNPVWKKPDWAFVEEGLPVPSQNHPSRYEYGVLGDYALSLGDGYLLHGTLYQRYLGLPVTHGCVRLADQDLEIIYNALEIGSKVYIY